MTTRFSLASLLLTGAASLALSGCYVEGQTSADVQPAQGEVVVADPPPPPPPVVEAPPPPPPQPGMIYIQGYHHWDGHAYVWMRGHYERPPRANARFTPGHWEARGRGKVWINGRWN